MINSASGTQNDKINKSFVESPLRGENFTAQEVVSTLDVGSRNLILGKDYDKIEVAYPDNVSEEFRYSLVSVEVFAIRVTYETSTKKKLITVEVI